MASETYDAILVGGGVMGSATAYYLLRYAPSLRVALIEMDSTYARASTPLSDGNLRVQFNIKENIQMSLYGLEVLARFADDMEVNGDRPDIAFRQQGNMFIFDEDGREEALEGLRLQQALGGQVEWLEPAQVHERYPLYNLERCAGAVFGRQDGTMSPMAVLDGYRKKAVLLGAHFVHGEVAMLLHDGRRVSGVRLADGTALHAPMVLNAAGPWAARLAATADVALPIVPVKRQVFVVEVSERPAGVLPGIFFPTGLYGFHEGEGVFTFGKSFLNDPITYDDFRLDRRLFEDEVWPELVEFMPAFDRLRFKQGWAGLYEVNTLDDNAILGEWPERGGLFLANGFSGHGFQQCHAVGRYLAELMLHLPPSLDLSIFGPERILANAPVHESKRKIV